MTSLVVFGAGGRAGRRITAAARDRGLRVTPVVRDLSRHPDVAGAVAGDVTDADAVAAVAAGHDVAVSAVYTPDIDPAQLYGAGTRSLLDGLTRAGTKRLLVVGLATTLDGPDGVKLYEAADFPDAYRPFSLGRVAELSALRDGPLDWVVFTPTMQLVDEPGTGAYEVTADRRLAEGTTTYADLAAAILDEVTSPAHHRTQLTVRTRTAP
ncbi:NAD(P)-dependent oxidoreductase [Dactylosporangium sp. NPDC000521]|uniref:NAD(P)-dependent oxidoreductase n=1 Tax=Dactylosporangium sp. NPDC000521 TaxID=3363975 RepID=UPI0036954A99